MNLESCKNCGIVVDIKKVKLIHDEIPDNPEEDERDEDGELLTEDKHYNPDLIWGYRGSGPLDTWKCRVCETFNGIGEE